MRIIRSALLVCASAALLAGAGCKKEAALPAENAEAKLWKSKYEDLAATMDKVCQEKEKISQEKEKAQQELASLRPEVEGLKVRLEQRGDVEAKREVEDLKKQLGEGHDTVEKLMAQVSNLKADLAEAKGQSVAQTTREQLDALHKKAAEVREGLERVGGLLLDASRYDSAREVLTSTVDLGSENPVTYFRIGYCEGALGNDLAAADWYARAASLAARDPEKVAALLPKLYNNYGATLLALGKFNDALHWYEKAAQADDKYAPVQFNLARLYADQLGDPQKAIEAYRRHIALGGGHSVTARNAILELQRKQTQKPPAEVAPPKEQKPADQPSPQPAAKPQENAQPAQKAP
jgi:tetratricopeptide (TPR) repeat protein